MLNKDTDIIKLQGNQTAIAGSGNLNNELVNRGAGFIYVFSSNSTATCSRFQRKYWHASVIGFFPEMN